MRAAVRSFQVGGQLSPAWLAPFSHHALSSLSLSLQHSHSVNYTLCRSLTHAYTHNASEEHGQPATAYSGKVLPCAMQQISSKQACPIPSGASHNRSAATQPGDLREPPPPRPGPHTPLLILCGVVVARHHGHPRARHQRLGGRLVTHRADGSGRGPNECHARLQTGQCEHPRGATRGEMLVRFVECRGCMYDEWWTVAGG